MRRHLGKRERQLTAPLPGAQDPQHDAGHDPTRGTERRGEPFTFAQARACGREGVAQGSPRERLARGDRPLEWHPSRHEGRDALEHNGEVAPTRRTTGRIRCRSDRQREQAPLGDGGARLRRRDRVDQPLDDAAVGARGAVSKRSHRCALSHDVMSASSFVPPGCPSRP